MFTVYALYSPSSDKLYIGYTSDIEQRLLSHNQLAKKGFTMKYRPWELFYTEEFESKQHAMKREKELKSYQGRVFLRSQLILKTDSWIHICQLADEVQLLQALCSRLMH